MDASIRKAFYGIGLLVIVVLFNLALYILIEFLRKSYVITDPVYPSLVLFLSFSLSIGIILITALGEKIHPDGADNDGTKHIGVTPIMVIVASIIAIFAGFSPLSTEIFPPTKLTKLKFMLADIGIRCLSDNRNHSPQATNLLAVISGGADYISSLTDYLTKKINRPTDKNYGLSWVHPVISTKIPGASEPTLDWEHLDNAGGSVYTLIREYAESKRMGAETLTDEMSGEDKWVAYSVEVRAPTLNTIIPVPATYDSDHTLRLFAVVSEPPLSKEPEVASLGTATLSSPSIVQKRRLLPLLQVQIEPHQPVEESQLTQLGVEIFADHICWQIGR